MVKVELKQPVADETKGVLEGAVDAIIVDYRGPTVEQDTQLRKKLREAGATYRVFKNIPIKRAAEGTEFAALESQLEGPTALAVSKEDAIAPARILVEFAKTAPKLELKASIIEGTYYDQVGTQVIATILSREVLLGKLPGSIQPPITDLARALNQIAEKNGGAAGAQVVSFSSVQTVQEVIRCLELEEETGIRQHKTPDLRKETQNIQY